MDHTNTSFFELGMGRAIPNVYLDLPRFVGSIRMFQVCSIWDINEDV